MAAADLAKYKVKAKLREIGGYLTIFSAHQPALDRDVELRVLQSLIDESSEAYAKFQAECKALASLDHPGILKVLDLGHSGERVFYVTDPPPGIPLKEYVAQGQAAGDVVIEIGVQLGQALDHLHSKGLLHRGLSLGGVHYDLQTGRVVICDFSLLKSVYGNVPSMRDLVDTDTFEALPERAHEWPIDQRSDVFLAGALLYSLLSGYDALSPTHLTRNPGYVFAPPSQHNPDCPPELDRVVLKAISRPPGDRQQTAQDLVRDLEGVRRRLMVRKASRALPALDVTAARAAIAPPRTEPKSEAKVPVRAAPARSRLVELTGIELDSPRTLGIFGACTAAILAVVLVRAISPGGGDSVPEAPTAPATTVASAPSASKVTLQPGAAAQQSDEGLAAPVNVALGDIHSAVADAAKLPTSEKNFNQRWDALKNWADELPAGPAGPPFSPMDLTTVRLKIYREPKEACRELDEMLEKAGEYLQKGKMQDFGR